MKSESENVFVFVYGWSGGEVYEEGGREGEGRKERERRNRNEREGIKVKARCGSEGNRPRRRVDSKW